MQDRLKEIKAQQYDVELEQFGRASQLQTMANFQAYVEEMKKTIGAIEQNNQDIIDLSLKYQNATTMQAEKEISNELESILSYNSSLTKNITSVFESMRQDIEQSKQENPNEPETQWKEDTLQTFQLKVQKVTKEACTIQTAYKEGLKDKISRQARFLDSDLTEKQIDEFVEDPDRLTQLLQQKMYGPASLQLQNAVNDIQDKYRDIKKLEKSVSQLVRLMNDMALLVENQGVLIDNIEMKLDKAHDYIKKGEKHLIDAKKDHTAARKKQCCIIVIGLVILLIILIPVLATTL